MTLLILILLWVVPSTALLVILLVNALEELREEGLITCQIQDLLTAIGSLLIPGTSLFVLLTGAIRASVLESTLSKDITLYKRKPNAYDTFRAIKGKK